MSEATTQDMEAFLEGDVFAVVGASKDREKYGNRVLRAYLEHGRKAIPVNPSETEVEGQRCYPDLASLPLKVHGVSIVTPPAVTEKVVDGAIEASLQRIWMQPGSEHEGAIERARDAGLMVIANGPCVLVALSRSDARPEGDSAASDSAPDDEGA